MKTKKGKLVSIKTKEKNFSFFFFFFFFWFAVFGFVFSLSDLCHHGNLSNHADLFYPDHDLFYHHHRVCDHRHRDGPNRHLVEEGVCRGPNRFCRDHDRDLVDNRDLCHVFHVLEGVSSQSTEKIFDLRSRTKKKQKKNIYSEKWVKSWLGHVISREVKFSSREWMRTSWWRIGVSLGSILTGLPLNSTCALVSHAFLASSKLLNSTNAKLQPEAQN